MTVFQNQRSILKSIISGKLPVWQTPSCLFSLKLFLVYSFLIDFLHYPSNTFSLQSSKRGCIFKVIISCKTHWTSACILFKEILAFKYNFFFWISLIYVFQCFSFFRILSAVTFYATVDWGRSGVFTCYGVPIVDFEQVNARFETIETIEIIEQ